MSAVAWLRVAVESVGWTAFLLMLRTAPLVVALPVFGGPKASPTVRAGVAFCLCALAWPASIAALPPDALHGVRVAASQLAFGLVAALGALFLVEAARAIGATADVALGRGSFGAADPLGGGTSGPLAMLYGLAFAAVFTASGSHLLLVRAFVDGQAAFPLDATLPMSAFQGAVDAATHLFAAAFAASVAFALPALGVGLIVDVSLGWMSRTLPQLPVLFVAMPLRSVLGWIVLGAGLSGALVWLSTQVIDAFVAASATL